MSIIYWEKEFWQFWMSELSAGIHEININGSSLASGIYIYKLDIESRFSQIKKMNLIK